MSSSGNLQPRDNEIGTYYNVPHDPVFHEDDARHLNSIVRPRRLKLPEVQSIFAEAGKITVAHANPYTFTFAERRRYYASAFNGGLQDRTLALTFSSVDDCTLPLLLNLQILLRRSHPTWRILIVGASAASSIWVYPFKIIFGSLPEMSQEAALREIADINRNAAPPDVLLEQAQLKVVRTQLSTCLASQLEFAIACLAFFDNWRGDFTRHTAWTVHKGDKSSIELIDPCDYEEGTSVYAKDDGDFGYHVGEEAPYSVREWIFDEALSQFEKMTFKIIDSHDSEKIITVDVTKCPRHRQR